MQNFRDEEIQIYTKAEGQAPAARGYAPEHLLCHARDNPAQGRKVTAIRKPLDIRYLPKYPLKPKLPAKVRAMTVAVGMICSDGIVLGSDRQVTLTDGHKYQAQKILPIDGIGWTSLITYAGHPDFAKEVQECLAKDLSTLERSEAMISGLGMGAVTMYDALDAILTNLGRQFGDVGTELLIAGHANGEDAKLWKFNGRSLCRADGFNF